MDDYYVVGFNDDIETGVSKAMSKEDAQASVAFSEKHYQPPKVSCEAVSFSELSQLALCIKEHNDSRDYFN